MNYSMGESYIFSGFQSLTFWLLSIQIFNNFGMLYQNDGIKRPYNLSG